MGKPGTWNARALWPSKTAPRPYVCMSCHQTQDWEQIGDLPERCSDCSAIHNTQTNHGKKYMQPWALHLAGEGTVLEQLDRVLHWSPELKRWLYYDGTRWTKGTHADGFGITKAILVSVDADAVKRRDSANRTLITVYETMLRYQQFCTERAGWVA